MAKAVFLDRDGTINVDKDYVYRLEDLEFLPKAIEGLKKMQDLGYLLIIITNQSGIGRGYYTEEDYHIVMKELYERLENEGVHIETDYYCPHSPEEICSCRKPGFELINKASKDYNINLNESFFIGDKAADILAGKNAGCKTILIRSDKEAKGTIHKVVPDFICDDLVQACEYLR